MFLNDIIYLKGINLKPILILSVLIYLSACSIKNEQCEKLSEISKQQKQCVLLKKRIIDNSNEPLLKSELERRYQIDCVDVRYYRDDQNIDTCEDKNKKSL